MGAESRGDRPRQPELATTTGGGGTQQDRNFICIEPMAGITNAINLAHHGVYKELQVVQPLGVWRESFWVKPSGF